MNLKSAALFVLICFTACSLKNKQEVLQNIPESSNEYVRLQEIAAQDQKLDFWSEYPHAVLADELINRMSNAQMLAQMYMFGWAGQSPSETVIAWVEERELGSVKIFGWNTDDVIQVAKSVILLQEKAEKTRFKIPLYVATDQEGGWIRHVKGTTSDTPGNLAIGASGFPYDAYYSGYYIAQELKALGINMNFAPTVDLYTNVDSTVIGPRSFGDNPEYAGKLGAAFSQGSIDVGVLTTAKHFPGHGDTALDSHGRLPQINIPEKMLYERELSPFIYVIKEKIPAIMSGHLAFPQITKSVEPASLSKIFLTGILRNKLGFEGLIITDDMMMAGAWQYAGSISNAFRMAIEAGNDILCSSTTPLLNDNLWHANLALMNTSADFKETVKKAAHRIILSKLWYFKSKNAVPIFPDLKTIEKNTNTLESKAFFLEQACRSITLYKSKTFPFKNEQNQKILIAAPYSYPAFADEAKKRYTNAQTVFFRSQFATEEDFSAAEQNIRYAARNSDIVFMYVINSDTARLAQSLRFLGKKVVIVSGLTPQPVLQNFDWAEAVLLIYSYSAFSFEAVFAALSGDFIPQGTVPLSAYQKHE